ncbi:TetR family transcriptional regulator [Mycobacterium sp. NPDC006124]|uniref:TetR family transcriptional regulator n=1 Tax=Mycobacterium sp. NPDC006124 TaxID=3156729 RepID=UPI0033B2049E
MSTPTSSELPVPTNTMPTRNLSSPLRAASVGSGLALHRRNAILDAVLVLAAEGGYGAVQMRTVAERAGIAVGTLYRYFASKNHLLASALTRQFHRLRGVRDWTTTAGSPQQRLERLTGYLHERWQRDPLLTEAMTKAFVMDSTSATAVNEAAVAIEHLLACTLCGGHPSATDRRVAGVIADIWLANMVAFVGGRASATQTRARMDWAAKRLLKNFTTDAKHL